MIGAKLTSKRFQQVWDSYKRSDNMSIFDAYKKPSHAKFIAWASCYELCKSIKGFDFKIIGGNCHNFSVGFQVIENANLYLIYITKENMYRILIKEGVENA
jgi:hypothetical protein